MKKDRITVLRNEFSAFLDSMNEQSLSDEAVVKKAIELEEELKKNYSDDSDDEDE